MSHPGLMLGIKKKKEEGGGGNLSARCTKSGRRSDRTDGGDGLSVLPHVHLRHVDGRQAERDQ